MDLVVGKEWSGVGRDNGTRRGARDVLLWWSKVAFMQKREGAI